MYPIPRSKFVELKIYYDGLCPVCSKEIEIYKNKTGNEKLQFIDIAHPSFDAPSEGLDPQEVHQKFHVKKANGEVIQGVDAFVEIWKVLNIWPVLQKMATSSLTRPLFDLGYVVFCQVRPFLRRNECNDAYCETKKF
jgi:predicted DCC family thiol-disulfide oxidoreductase YuxK